MKYFDYAASSPLDKEAADLYVKTATEYYGNSQSLHDIGYQANALLENARKEMSKLFAVEADGIFFTSGGSESNLLGIRALLSGKLKEGAHIITGIAEHDSVYLVMKMLQKEGYEVTYLPFNREGKIEVAAVEEAMREDTILVSIQHANPEIGTLQPIKEISSLCKKNQVLLHSDCVQSFGKTPIQEVSSVVDALSISGHKFYGPKGTGVAYVNPRVAWRPYIEGVTHEKGLRAGTVNVPGILAMTLAAQKAVTRLDEEMDRLTFLREVFTSQFSLIGNSVTIYPSQLPGLIGMCLHGHEGQWVMLECNRRGFAISTGTACHVGLLTPSKTMAAIGVTGKAAKEFFRISFGRQTSEEDVRSLGGYIAELAQQAEMNELRR
ncbi:IscS subfamily cysteine desulfurase [Mesobacillus maritimus]|uniref:IscS subfamily cysteine desulfurase n=1 Tax=Mesobacillus maritimus TaxID=1643336 RepID=A0ABS7K1W3_9BACI|nr:IscS subfamily cysteine desulfurase [Mesobacillus maritimus]MBY0096237.1 IscS subfamily cysteine desulfurase [Mesobacillus maritimus]